ncbi:hypothetical protein Ocin01_00451 [Orchesella cincta]|uniref:Uncharacterized protein n=1 Tax=Orchesella cincta TaxID=48709 RepID=A0A1D2NLQ0_ORCCI|nr:hypothetical protein Ocin01_00451 [Orchesella cincta]
MRIQGPSIALLVSIRVDDVWKLKEQIQPIFDEVLGKPISYETFIAYEDLRKEALELIQRFEEFHARVKDYAGPIERIIDLWTAVKQTAQGDDNAELKRRITGSKDVKWITNLDVRKLELEWSKMNLAQRLQAIISKLNDLSRLLPKETVFEAEITATIITKRRTVTTLMQEIRSFVGLLNEIVATNQEIFTKTMVDEFVSYTDKASDAFETCKKAEELLVNVGDVNIIRSQGLVNDKSVQEAIAIDAEALGNEWNQLRLVHLMRDYADEKKTLNPPENRINQRAYEL